MPPTDTISSPDTTAMWVAYEEEESGGFPVPTSDVEVRLDSSAPSDNQAGERQDTVAGTFSILDPELDQNELDDVSTALRQRLADGDEKVATELTRIAEGRWENLPPDSAPTEDDRSLALRILAESGRFESKVRQVVLELITSESDTLKMSAVAAARTLPIGTRTALIFLFKRIAQQGSGESVQRAVDAFVSRTHDAQRRFRANR